MTPPVKLSDIMEHFCLSIDDDDLRDDLWDALHGRGAFKRCKDRAHGYGLTAAWYRYRDAALREIPYSGVTRMTFPLVRQRAAHPHR